jgi:hypothetical protein
MDQDLAGLQETMKWDEHTMYTLLVSFIQHRRLDGQCMDYLHYWAERFKQEGGFYPPKVKEDPAITEFMNELEKEWEQEKDLRKEG